MPYFFVTVEHVSELVKGGATALFCTSIDTWAQPSFWYIQLSRHHLEMVGKYCASVHLLNIEASAVQL